MAPCPIAETSRLLLPSFRFCIVPPPGSCDESTAFASELLPPRPKQDFVDVHILGLAHGLGDGSREGLGPRSLRARRARPGARCVFYPVSRVLLYYPQRRQAGDVSGMVVASCSLPMNADDTDLGVGRTS